MVSRYTDPPAIEGVSDALEGLDKVIDVGDMPQKIDFGDAKATRRSYHVTRVKAATRRVSAHGDQWAGPKDSDEGPEDGEA